MLSQVIWSLWAGLPPVTDPNLEAIAIITFWITQPLKGVGLRVLYLAERVYCQPVGKDAPQVLMDPPQFMLAPLFMTDAKYQLWKNDIPYARRLVDDLDYDEFNETRLIPFLVAEVFTLSLYFPFFFSCISTHGDTQV